MIKKLKPNIYQLYFKEFSSTVYLIQINNQNILIDSGSREARENLIKDLEELNLQPNQINTLIITHNHYDHNENNDLFNNAKIYTHKNIDTLSKDIKEFTIYKVPGHSKDSIAIMYNKVLFSGDTIFHNEGIGRYDFPESEPNKIMKSVNFLRNLDYEILAPGHV